MQKETVAQQPEQTSSAELAIATSQAQDRQTAQHIAEKAAPAEQDAIRQEPAKEKTTEVGLNGNASDQKAAALPNGAQFLSLSTRFESNPKNQKGGSNRYEKGGPKSSELRIPTMFDCSKVSFGSDYVVCASPELLDAEARLEDAYNSARLADKEDRVKSDQRDWIRQLQSNCGLPYRGNPGAALIRGSSRCVKQAIEQRIFQLVVLQF